MGRPKEHDETTRAGLLASAEDVIAGGGPDALSVRLVAERAGTSTRAIYSLFGSKDGLIAALAARAFEILGTMMDALPETADAAADLTGVGVAVFRPFVLEHPALFRIAFHRIAPELMTRPDVIDARSKALPKLIARVERVKDAGLLGNKSVMEAAIAYNALCEGLANAELRGATLPILPAGHEEQAWDAALSTLVRGFAAPARPRAKRRRPTEPAR